jgi:hypothetical protein
MYSDIISKLRDLGVDYTKYDDVRNALFLVNDDDFEITTKYSKVLKDIENESEDKNNCLS